MRVLGSDFSVERFLVIKLQRILWGTAGRLVVDGVREKE